MALSPITRGMTGDAAGFRQTVGPAASILPFNRDWLFAGRQRAQAEQPAFSPVTLPHCVAKLSWQNWDPAAWQDVWNYRRQFAVPPEFRDARVFLHFDAVMVGAMAILNGHEFPRHLGGYLPFEYELTNFLIDGENSLELVVDSRRSNVPPEGSQKGTKSSSSMN
jgi:beta-galactosidase